MKKWFAGLYTLLGLVALVALTVLLNVLFGRAKNPVQVGQATSPVETPVLTPPPESELVFQSPVETPTLLPTPTPWPTHTPWPTRTPWPTPTQDAKTMATVVPLREPAANPKGVILYCAYPLMDEKGAPIGTVIPLHAVEVDERGESKDFLGLDWDQFNQRMYFDRMIPSPDDRYLAGILSEETGERVCIVDTKTGKYTLPEPGCIEVTGLLYGWHPQGDQVVLKAIDGQDPGLWLVDIYTGKHQLIAQPKPPDGISGAAISPDGRWLAYGFTPGAVTTPSPYEGIWLAEGNGRNVRQVAPYSGYVFSWSPDGKYFIYIGGRAEDQPPEQEKTGKSRMGPLFSVMNVQTGEHRPLPISFAFGYGHYPEWSPDSRSIIYVGFDDVSIPTSESKNDPTRIFQGVGIYVLDVESANVRRLASGIDPAWSPDGSMIVFSALQDGQADIWMINADGSNLRRLNDTPEIDWRPIWVKQ